MILDRVSGQVQLVGDVLGRQALADESSDRLSRAVSPKTVMIIGAIS